MTTLTVHLVFRFGLSSYTVTWPLPTSWFKPLP